MVGLVRKRCLCFYAMEWSTLWTSGWFSMKPCESGYFLNKKLFQNLSKCNCAYGYARDSNGVCIPEHECPEPTPECPMVRNKLWCLPWIYVCLGWILCRMRMVFRINLLWTSMVCKITKTNKWWKSLWRRCSRINACFRWFCLLGPSGLF